MVYCSDCGREVAIEASFCSNCGTEIDHPNVNTDSVPTENNSTIDEFDQVPEKNSAESSDEVSSSNIEPKQLGVATGMSLIVGLQVALGFAELGGGGFLFIVTLVGVSGYLYQQTDSPKHAFGTGLYIVAAWFILAPLLFYLGLAGQNQNEFAAIGAILGMVIFGFIGLLFAIVSGGLGYFINSRLNDSTDAPASVQ